MSSTAGTSFRRPVASIAHQRIVVNLCLVLMGLLQDRPLLAVQEMRLRIGAQIRYPGCRDLCRQLDQTTRTLTDAVAVFEVLSDDTATTDRVVKLIDYAAVPSLRCLCPAGTDRGGRHTVSA